MIRHASQQCVPNSDARGAVQPCHKSAVSWPLTDTAEVPGDLAFQHDTLCVLRSSAELTRSGVGAAQWLSLNSNSLEEISPFLSVTFTREGNASRSYCTLMSF